MDFNALVIRFQQVLKPNKLQKPNDNHHSPSESIPWNWVCSSLISVLEKYASGATEAIILSELQSRWDETPTDWNDNIEAKVTGLSTIGETQTVGVLDVQVVSTRCLPDTHVWIVTVQDSLGTKMDHYLHPQLSELAAGPCPLLVQGRGLRVVGTRMSTVGSPPHPVLLPTVLLGVMLGTVAGVFDDHLTDPFETTPFSQLHQFQGTNGACAVAAKVLGVRGNSIYLSEPSASNHVVLELPHAHRHMLQLVKKGELLRITPYVPPNFTLHSSTAMIKYIPGTMICIQASNNKNNNSHNSNNNKTTSLINGAELTMGASGVRDMRYTTERMRMVDIGPSMSGISVVGRITKMLRNHPTTDNFPRYPVQLSDAPPLLLSASSSSSSLSQPQSADVTVWDNVQLRVLRPGMLVYAEDLFATTPKEPNISNQAPKYHVIASREYNTRMRAISTLPAILTSSLFPSSLLSLPHLLMQAPTPYHQQPSNFIVRATILDYDTQGIEPPVNTAHARCLRAAHLADERTHAWECRWCGVRAQAAEKGEWEKIFNLKWKIGDGSAECWVYASPKVHEVILQTRASAFAELDLEEQRVHLADVVSINYLFSLSLAVEGHKKYLRIDQLVPPNPIVETKKLLDELTNHLC